MSLPFHRLVLPTLLLAVISISLPAKLLAQTQASQESTYQLESKLRAAAVSLGYPELNLVNALDEILKSEISESSKQELAAFAYQLYSKITVSRDQNRLFLERYTRYLAVDTYFEELFYVSPNSAIRLLTNPKVIASANWRAWLQKSLIFAHTNTLKTSFTSTASLVPTWAGPKSNQESLHLVFAKLLTIPEVTLSPDEVRMILSYPEVQGWYLTEGSKNSNAFNRYSKVIQDYLAEGIRIQNLKLEEYTRTFEGIIEASNWKDAEKRIESGLETCPACVAAALSKGQWLSHPKWNSWISRLMIFGVTHDQRIEGQSSNVWLAKLMMNRQVFFSATQVQILMSNYEVQRWFAKDGIRDAELMLRYKDKILSYFKFRNELERGFAATLALMDVMKSPAIIEHLEFVDVIGHLRGSLNNKLVEVELEKALQLPHWQKHKELLAKFINESDLRLEGFSMFRLKPKVFEVNAANLLKALSTGRTFSNFLIQEGLTCSGVLRF